MKENGFVPIRRGIWEHVRDGRLSLTAFAIYTYMISQADTRTGVWSGSAGALAFELSIPKSTAKYTLARLERADYIRRFTIPGKHSCYPILLHKFLVTQGQHIGLRLDALNSVNEKTLTFLPDDDCQQVIQQVVQQVVPQRISENREERKPPQTASANPPADTLEAETKQAAFDLFWERWPRKQALSDAKRAWWKVPLAEYPLLMAALEKFLTCDQWRRGVIPHASTWLNKKRWQDEDIPQFSERGATNGNPKPSANDAAAAFIKHFTEQSRPN